MKTVIAALVAVGLVALYVALALLEFMMRLAPLLIVAAAVGAVYAANRRRRRQARDLDDQRLLAEWGHNPVSLSPAQPSQPVCAPRPDHMPVHGSDARSASHGDRGTQHTHTDPSPLPREPLFAHPPHMPTARRLPRRRHSTRGSSRP